MTLSAKSLTGTGPEQTVELYFVPIEPEMDQVQKHFSPDFRPLVISFMEQSLPPLSILFFV